MAHDHSGHDHGAHAPRDFNRAFAIGTALNLGFVAVELGFGFYANSLALIADAAHNFSDVVGLLLAWGGAWLAARAPTTRHTYGFRRASILAALGNAALLFVAVGGIAVEALRRFGETHEVASGTVIWVASIGIVLNGATALLFMRGRERDVNIQGAFLHMAADAAVSLGVVIAALVIMRTGWSWIDPAVSLAIAAAILASTWGLARRSVALALDAIPAGIDRATVESFLRDLPGVTEVHDLHIWPISTTETALTAHLVRPGTGLDDRLLRETAHQLEHRFGIGHATLQIEAGDGVCELASQQVV